MDQWMSKANCRGLDPDLFFPEKGASTRAALAVCAGCEVRRACRQAALDRNEKIGVWGGTTGLDRRRIKRDQRLAAEAPVWISA